MSANLPTRRSVVLKRRPRDEPSADDFEVQEDTIPTPGPGEVVTRMFRFFVSGCVMGEDKVASLDGHRYRANIRGRRSRTGAVSVQRLDPKLRDQRDGGADRRRLILAGELGSYLSRRPPRRRICRRFADSELAIPLTMAPASLVL